MSEIKISPVNKRRARLLDGSVLDKPQVVNAHPYYSALAKAGDIKLVRNAKETADGTNEKSKESIEHGASQSDTRKKKGATS